MQVVLDKHLNELTRLQIDFYNQRGYLTVIDDTDEENVAMEVSPRTHRRGYLKTRKYSGSAVLNQEVVGFDRLKIPVVDRLRTSQTSLHVDLLVHGSESSCSYRRPCGLTIRYRSPEVRITDSKWRKSVEAIICRGKNTSGR